jgi:hypothetical protein
LAHLLAQNPGAGAPWVVLIIDNHSTDHTSTVTKSLWRSSALDLWRL